MTRPWSRRGSRPWGWGAFIALLALAIFGTTGAAASEAPEYRLILEPVPLAALDLERSGALTAVLAMPAPDQDGETPASDGLVVWSAGDGHLYHLPWIGPPRRLAGVDGADEPWTQPPPLHLEPWKDEVLVTRGSARQIQSFAAPPQSSARSLPPAYSVGPLTRVGKQVFILTPPVVSTENEPPRWDDSSWRRSHVRRDCALALLDAADPAASHRPRLCDPIFDSPTGRILRGGDLVSNLEGDKAFVVAAAQPMLNALSPKGEILWQHSYLRPGEAAPTFSAADESAQYASPQAALEIRDRYPSFLSLLRWPQSVGLLFRSRSGDEVRFHLDLFDYEGRKLADDLLLPLPPTGLRGHVQALNFSDGRVMILHQDRTLRGGRWTINRQKLFELPPPLSVSEASGAKLRFELRDQTSGDPVYATRLTLRQQKYSVERQLASSTGSYEIYLASTVSAPSQVDISASGFQPVTLHLEGPPEASSPPKDPGERTIDLGTLSLDPGLGVEGVLLHELNGEPLVGSRISHVPPHPWGTLAARRLGHERLASTDSQGFFRLTGLNPGAVCLRIDHPHVAPSSIALSLQEESAFHRLDALLLGKGQPVSGRVVDAEDKPVPDARVDLRQGPWSNPCLRRSVYTDEAGRFLFPEVAAGDFRIGIYEARQLAALDEIQVDGEALEVGTLRLESRSYEGTVRVGQDSRPSGWLTLRLADSEDFSPPPVFFAHSGSQELVSDLPPRAVTRVEDGRFSTRGFFPGEWLVAEFHPEEESLAGVVFRSRVDAEASILRLDFEGTTVRGWALDARGAPAPGAQVTLVQDGLAVREVTSSEAGLFELAAAPPKPWKVVGVRGELRGEAVEEQPGELLLSLSAQGSPDIVLRVHDHRGKALARTLLYLSGLNAAQAERLSSTSPDGRARIRAPEPGAYRITALAGGSLLQGPVVTVNSAPEGVSNPHSVSLATEAALPVRLRLGEELAGQRTGLALDGGYSVGPLLGYSGMELRVDPEGYLDLPPLSPGRWELILHRQQQRIPFRVAKSGGEQDVAEPETMVIDLR
ncbi:MAG: carboxypeptidase-like regulatory domain-containing protein [Acidobacteriota bacterium]|nr:carboxypeptidase-like regulatory domain-containing protein [Acidobacteriota bacterium]